MARKAFVRVIVACKRNLGEKQHELLVVDRYGRSCCSCVESGVQLVEPHTRKASSVVVGYFPR